MSRYVLVSSALLAFAFVFGSTAATMFRALVMIFVTNPFGVGDWVRFGGGRGGASVRVLHTTFNPSRFERRLVWELDDA